MSDIGSGLNYKRKNFNRLMEMVELGQVRRIVIAHRDRLVRFGCQVNPTSKDGGLSLTPESRDGRPLDKSAHQSRIYQD